MYSGTIVWGIAQNKFAECRNITVNSVTKIGDGGFKVNFYTEVKFLLCIYDITSVYRAGMTDDCKNVTFRPPQQS
jgi:hypothetical protein